MSTIEVGSVTISSQTTQATSVGNVEIQKWDQQDRLKLALKNGVICWALILIGILIPIVHFFLVPALVLAGPIVALITYKRTSAVIGGTGVCPDCQKSFQIEKAENSFPLSDVCEHCRSSLKIST